MGDPSSVHAETTQITVVLSVRTSGQITSIILESLTIQVSTHNSNNADCISLKVTF